MFGCETMQRSGLIDKKMSIVIEDCEAKNATFKQVVGCLKNDYMKNPNAMSVKTFFAELDAALEKVNNKTMTETEARAFMYKSYDGTIERDNRESENSSGKSWGCSKWDFHKGEYVTTYC